MSLLFNMLPRFVIAFLPRIKHLLISWLQSPPAVILEFKTINSITVSIVFPSICIEVMGPGAMILVFRLVSFVYRAFQVALVVKNLCANAGDIRDVVSVPG